MKLTKPMLKAFYHITQGENTLTKLSGALGKSKYWTDLVLSSLEKEEFIVKSKNFSITGSRFIIEVASTAHASKLRDLLFKYQGISFEKILTDGRLLFLMALSEDWITKEVAMQLSKLSKYSIDRYMPSLKNRGVIVKKKMLYRVSERWPLMKDFLITYKNYSKVNGQVKWKYGEETIFQVNNQDLVHDHTTTGLHEYKVYGVQVGVISALCVLPKRKLSKEDIFIHSLFEVDDPRTLHLALTFYLKNKLEYEKVMLLAMKYGKYTMFEDFVKLLKAKEDKVKFESLPIFDRKDFIRIAHMYGVNYV